MLPILFGFCLGIVGGDLFSLMFLSLADESIPVALYVLLGVFVPLGVITWAIHRKTHAE